MQSIIPVTHCADLDVSSAVDCVQLALSIRYGLYMFGWEEGLGKQACVYVGSLERERERLVAMINTCRHEPKTSHQMLRCQPNIGFWDRYPCSVNHGPSLNCSPMCKCMRHLIKALWWQGGPCEVMECVQCAGLWNENLFATCLRLQDERIDSCS